MWVGAVGGEWRDAGWHVLEEDEVYSCWRCADGVRDVLGGAGGAGRAAGRLAKGQGFVASDGSGEMDINKLCVYCVDNLVW